MKNIFILAMILILLLTSSACNDGNVKKADESSDQIVNSDNAASEPKNTSQEGSDDNGSEDVPLKGIYGFDEFDAYLTNHKDNIPEHFIAFKESSPFGKFESIVFLEDVRDLQYNEYMYTFSVGEEDYDANLYVYHYDRMNKFEGNSVISEVPNNNLLTCPDGATGIYTHNGVKYSYYKGELRSVKWFSNGITYIYGMSNQKTFNDEGFKLESEIADKLFTKSGNLEAIKMFDEMINSEK